MAIHYVLKQRASFKAASTQHKYFAVQKSTGQETLDEMIDEISTRSGFDSIEVKAILDVFVGLIPERIAEGKIVQLGDLGSFFLTIRSEEVDRSEDFNISMIKGSRLNFYPSELIERELQKIDYQKVVNE